MKSCCNFFISAFFLHQSALSRAFYLHLFPPTQFSFLSLHLLIFCKNKIKLSYAWEFKCKMATKKYTKMHSTSRILGQMFKAFVFDFFLTNAYQMSRARSIFLRFFVFFLVVIHKVLQRIHKRWCDACCLLNSTGNDGF